MSLVRVLERGRRDVAKARIAQLVKVVLVANIVQRKAEVAAFAVPIFTERVLEVRPPPGRQLIPPRRKPIAPFMRLRAVPQLHRKLKQRAASHSSALLFRRSGQGNVSASAMAIPLA